MRDVRIVPAGSGIMRSHVLMAIRSPLARGILLGACAAMLCGCAASVLDPVGPVGAGERIILLDSLAIMLAIVIPTIGLTLYFAWKYRSSNTKATYRPDWAYSGRLELLVWSIPTLVVLFLGGIGWVSSHDLDPSKPLESKTKPMELQVVSLDWKWLFIYPEQGIASLNHLVIPTGVPVHFQLTSATVMNSFFIPQLGSQIYTMSGMATQLNLQADRSGQYQGISAQFSGDGFSDMNFAVDVLSQSQFSDWIGHAKSDGSALDAAAYAALLEPSSAVAPTTYRSVGAGLFESIVNLRPIAAKSSPSNASRSLGSQQGPDHKGS